MPPQKDHDLKIMKRKSSTLAVLAFSALMAASSHAAIMVWNFTDGNSTVDSGTPVNFAISDMSIGNSNGTVATPINSSSPSTYTGASGTNNIGNAFRTGPLGTGVGQSGYLEFTVTPFSGFTFILSDMDFGMRSTLTGPLSYALRASSDAYTANIFTGSNANNGLWTLKNNTFTAFNSTVPGASVTFRLFAFDGAGNAAPSTINGRFDDISIDLTAIPEPSSALLGAIGALGLLRRRRLC
ncbi:MAG: hypothetical protein EAZ42_01130 [Verrucomicrobia bacterium]|nr:MAG: hypothetical protein EAZ42_01130 [Verrucomicrobiota bacterium]